MGARPRAQPAGDRNVAVSTRRSRYRYGEVRGFALYFFNAVRMRHSGTLSDRYSPFRDEPLSPRETETSPFRPEGDGIATAMFADLRVTFRTRFERATRHHRPIDISIFGRLPGPQRVSSPGTVRTGHGSVGNLVRTRGRSVVTAGNGLATLDGRANGHKRNTRALRSFVL